MYPLQIFTLPRRVLVVAAVSVTAVFLAGLFLYQVYAQPLPSRSTTEAAVSAPGKAYLSAQGAAAASATAVAPPPLEIHIANNGLVLLRGAQVVSVAGDTIRVTMAFGGASFTWRATTNSGTKFITATGAAESLADIQAGDVVTVTGMLIQNDTEPTLTAQFVRE